MAVNVSGSVTVSIEMEVDVDIDETYEIFSRDALQETIKEALLTSIEENLTYGNPSIEITGENLDVDAELDGLEVSF